MGVAKVDAVLREIDLSLGFVLLEYSASVATKRSDVKYYGVGRGQCKQT
jgi:hypothetical protein